MLWIDVKLHMLTMVVEWLMRKLCESDRDLQEIGFFVCVCLDLKNTERERERERERDFKRLFDCI